ncbi:flavin-containing monooxygenase [Streptomyces sp. NPDC018045]|uniref:flavin-containing monooxygenase n=1 Tax=Streptomyces sp. NPDC018045 TaxID=3365037 RepID=UPI00379100BA
MAATRDSAPPPVVVIGAGPSGLATAAMLRRARVPAVVIDSGARIGDSWRGHYDHLRLHTTRALSGLPGLAVPRGCGTWVSRDDWADYLERYATHHRLDIRTHTTAEHLRPAPACTADTPYAQAAARWYVRTGSGEHPARAVVLATGRNRVPYVPDWPGRATFTGRLLHSREYRGAESCTGRTVLVVGAGNSGTEIAVAVGRAGAARVWLSVRTPPNIVPRGSSRWQALGLWAHRLPPAWGDRAAGLMRRLSLPDLSAHGLPAPAEGLYSRSARDGASPVHDRGIVAAVRAGHVRPVAAVTGLDGPRVVLADGTELTPDIVVAATGYRPGLEPLLDPLPVLGARGHPLVSGARTSPDAPGLYFAGYTNPLSGALYQAAADARHIARALRGRFLPLFHPVMRV